MDYSGSTALMLAETAGHDKVVELFDVDTDDSETNEDHVDVQNNENAWSADENDRSFPPKISKKATADHPVRESLSVRTNRSDYQTNLQGSAEKVISPMEQRLESVPQENSVMTWKQGIGVFVSTIKHTHGFLGVAISHDGKLIASASSDLTVRLWETTTGNLIKTLTRHAGRVLGVAFLKDGKLIVSASEDSTIKLWETSTGALVKTLNSPDHVWGVAFLQDGKLIASATGDRTVRLWETATGNLIKTLTGHAGPVLGVAISHDGKLIASASYDRTVRLWETGTGNLVKTLSHQGGVGGVAFSQDGKLVATASSDGTVRLWEPGPSLEAFTCYSTYAKHWKSGGGAEYIADGKPYAFGERLVVSQCLLEPPRFCPFWPPGWSRLLEF